MQKRGCLIGIPFIRKTSKLVLYLSFLLVWTLPAQAQTAGNRYRSHLSNGGITYFFCPRHLKSTKNIEKFTFDMTYHTSSDSVTLNFTFMSEKPVNVRTLTVTNEGIMTYEGKQIATLFRDIIGKKYEIRTTSRFSLADIRQMFSRQETLSFDMSLSDGTACRATYKHSQWTKECRQITQIINLINYPQ